MIRRRRPARKLSITWGVELRQLLQIDGANPIWYAVMDKLGWLAIGVFAAAFGADQYWNFGKYTDATLNVLHEIQHSFGW